jgi:hypothetical protein
MQLRVIYLVGRCKVVMGQEPQWEGSLHLLTPAPSWCVGGFWVHGFTVHSILANFKFCLKFVEFPCL